MSKKIPYSSKIEDIAKRLQGKIMKKKKIDKNSSDIKMVENISSLIENKIINIKK